MNWKKKKKKKKKKTESARIVTGPTKVVSINTLLSETGWETLATRRKTHKLQLFFKMVNALSPEYLSSLVPPTVGSLTPYPLPNATNIHTIQSTSQLYYNSFLSSVIRDWNELSEDVRNSTTINSFKCKLNSNIRVHRSILVELELDKCTMLDSEQPVVL